jgi:hypothetical protein
MPELKHGHKNAKLQVPATRRNHAIRMAVVMVMIQP